MVQVANLTLEEKRKMLVGLLEEMGARPSLRADHGRQGAQTPDQWLEGRRAADLEHELTPFLESPGENTGWGNGPLAGACACPYETRLR